MWGGCLIFPAMTKTPPETVTSVSGSFDGPRLTTSSYSQINDLVPDTVDDSRSVPVLKVKALLILTKVVNIKGL